VQTATASAKILEFLRVLVPSLLLLAQCATASSAGANTSLPVSFAARRDFLVSQSPISVAVGDFNGDGIRDLAVTNSDSVSVLLGNGDGTFQTARNITLGHVSQVVASDLNADGKDDLAVTDGSSTSQYISILLSNGDGTFQTPIHIGTVSATIYTGLAAGDLNADGKIDLVALNWANTAGPGSLAVFLGNGDGTFGSPADFSVANKPESIVLADFNGDGKPDLAVGSAAGTISTLLGNGDGTFGSAQTIPGGSGAYQLATADLNLDGKVDLVVAAGTTILVLLGDGDGTFQAPLSFSVGMAVTIAVGDLNGDRKPDLVFAGSGSEVTVMLGDGNGSFGSATTFPTGNSPAAVALADFDGDGKTDLVTVNAGSNSVSILQGKGDGTFVEASTVGPTTGYAALAGDFNRDGKADLAVAIGYAVAILLGNGNGTFQAEVHYGIPCTGNLIASGDFDGDGIPDLVVGEEACGNISILLGNGDGTFQGAKTFTAGKPVSLALADFNGDDKLDIAALNQSGTGNEVDLFFGKGDGTFQTPVVTSLSCCSSALALAAGDFNGDGKTDVIVVGGGGVLLLGNGNGTFQAPTTFGSQSYGFVATSDFDKDGKLDFAAIDANAVDVFRGNGDGTFQLPVSYAVGLNPVIVRVADLNNDTVPDLITVNHSDLSISVLVGNGDGTFQSADTFGTGEFPADVAIGDFNNDGTLDPAAPTTEASVTLLLSSAIGPKVSLSPSSISFGDVTVGTSVATGKITLTNSGGSSLSVASISITGANASDYSETNTCGTNVAVGANCTVSVTFTPAAAGSRNATLSVADNAYNSPQTVSLSGTGTSSLGLGIAPGGSSSITVAAGSTASYMLTIGGQGASGTATLTCTGAPKGADCSVPTSETVSATAASTFTVSVSTTSRTLAASAPSSLPFRWSFVTAVLCLGMIQIRPKGRRRSTRFLRYLPFALLLWVCSCGGSGNPINVTNPNGTPAGTYTLTLKATSGAAAQSTSLTLIVQ